MKNSLSMAILLISIGATGGLLASGGEHEGDKRLPPVTNDKWRAECGACHLAYHPGLLPERSWRKLMSGLDKHFSENASLDAATTAEITKFLADNAADRSGNRRSNKIVTSMSAAATPLRISETAYFLRKHDELDAAVFRRPKIVSAANCAACHQTAERGDFSEGNVRIPR